jgi:glycolate oxidase
MRVLARAEIPVVGRGAGTGLSGGATPVAGGRRVGPRGMRDVLELDRRPLRARAGRRSVNVDLDQRVREARLFYAPDPVEPAGCTIGGNVGRELGGPHCFKYGATTRHIWVW